MHGSINVISSQNEIKQQMKRNERPPIQEMLNSQLLLHTDKKQGFFFFFWNSCKAKIPKESSLFCSFFFQPHWHTFSSFLPTSLPLPFSPAELFTEDMCASLLLAHGSPSRDKSASYNLKCAITEKPAIYEDI